MSEPITREEMYLAALGGDAVTLPDPLTREELYLAYLNGMTDAYPDPITRTEQYLYTLCQNGMGSSGGVTIRNQNKTITENGTYRHDTGYTGLGTVTVNVPQKDPVVQPLEVTENGTYSPPAGVDGYSPVTVNVAVSGGTGGTEDIAKSILDRTITEYSNEELTRVGNYAFSMCSKLASVHLPNVTLLEVAAFDQCGSLTRITLPKLTTMWRSAFNAAQALEYADLGNLAEMGASIFYGAKKLKTIILRREESILPLPNTNNFTNTPFASGGTGGTVYVPAALISAYQTATNWSTLYAAGTCNFVAIEGSEYE